MVGINLKFIRDSVHGDLKLNDLEVELIDSPQIQRLRRIKQLGFTYLVYPGANHTRFEHSIGTMYLASRLADHLKLDEHEKQMLRTCAIIHDAGHGPFSHVSEQFTTSHEKSTFELVKNSELTDIIMKNFDLSDILNILQGKGSLGQIIAGELDVDRMDYLLRDSYYTGVAYGIIDVERLLYNMILDDQLIIKRKGIQAAESMLLARYFMYPSVYQHHTTRIVNRMFQRCLETLFHGEVINPEYIYKYDDLDVISAARANEGYAHDMIQRIDNRDLFKTVYSLKLDEISDYRSVFNISDSDARKVELEVSEDLDISTDHIILDVPKCPSFDEMSTLVSLDGVKVELGRISMLVKALKGAHLKYTDLCFYLPRDEAYKSLDFPFKEYLPIKTE